MNQGYKLKVFHCRTFILTAFTKAVKLTHIFNHLFNRINETVNSLYTQGILSRIPRPPHLTDTLWYSYCADCPFWSSTQQRGEEHLYCSPRRGAQCLYTANPNATRLEYLFQGEKKLAQL